MSSRVRRLAPVLCFAMFVMAVVPMAAGAATKPRPDLLVTSVSAPPALLAPGQTYRATVKVKNRGKARAGASSTGFYWSTNSTRGSGDVLVSKGATPRIRPGKVVTLRMTIPVTPVVASGSKRMVVCADVTKRVPDVGANDCKPSATALTVRRPVVTIATPAAASTTGLRTGAVGQFSATGVGALTITCALGVDALAACAPPIVLRTHNSGLAAGTVNTFTVRAADAFGNVTTLVRTWSIDADPDTDLWTVLDGDCDNGDDEITPGIGDSPDKTDPFVDSNCDGIDGNASQSFFVSTSGSDLNPGTITQPFKTIQRAMDDEPDDAAVVLVAAGSYTEDYVEINDGTLLVGGYSAADWERDPSSHEAIINGHLWMHGGTGNTVQHMTVNTPAETTPGWNTYGAYIESGSAYIEYVDLTVASAADGEDAPPATPWGPTTDGGAGQSSTCAVNESFRDGGLPGEPDQSNGQGGIGGHGRTYWEPLDSIGENAKTGAGVYVPLSGGQAAGEDGLDGGDGASGPDGIGGTGGTVVGGHWTANPGQGGAGGVNGTGGGGGAAGNFGIALAGPGGGGGGHGGLGGKPGDGGGGGGGSFGVYVDGGSANVNHSVIATGSGGTGGSGSSGLPGDVGSGGGSGGLANGCPGMTDGGAGGDGGNGGNGGDGGGGAGGPSWGIFGSAMSTANMFTIGGGGAGGAATNPGAAGASGTVSP